MKVAISTVGNSLDSPVDFRFGRAKNFLVYDTEEKDFQVIENRQNLNLPQGAGIQAAQNVANLGVDAVITGHVGPKAYQTLKAADIDIYLIKKGTVNEAIQKFQENKLNKAEGPDKEGHW